MAWQRWSKRDTHLVYTMAPKHKPLRCGMYTLTNSVTHYKVPRVPLPMYPSHRTTCGPFNVLPRTTCVLQRLMGYRGLAYRRNRRASAHLGYRGSRNATGRACTRGGGHIFGLWSSTDERGRRKARVGKGYKASRALPDDESLTATQNWWTKDCAAPSAFKESPAPHGQFGL